MPRLPVISGCTAIITGASSGLGAEFARQLASRAACLVLAARTGEKLQLLADQLVQTNGALRVETVACDLASDAGRELMWEKVDVLGLQPTLLINNAGLGDYGAFMAADRARIRQQIDLNITALTLNTYEFLARVPAARDRPGAVVNVSSLAGSTPMPDLAVYAATKAYVSSFSEGLAIELAERRVHVLAVCPGPTPTNFSTYARRADNRDTDRTGQEFLKMPPQRVVAIALQSLEAGRRRVFPGWRVGLAAFLFEKMPRRVLRSLLAVRYRRSQHAS